MCEIQGPSAVAGGIVGSSSTSATDLLSKAMPQIYSLRVRVCADVCIFVDVRVCMRVWGLVCACACPCVIVRECVWRAVCCGSRQPRGLFLPRGLLVEGSSSVQWTRDNQARYDVRSAR